MTEITPVRIRIRYWYEKIGRRYHCQLFTSYRPGEVFVMCGSLVFDDIEWPYIVEKWSHIEFIESSSHELT